MDTESPTEYLRKLGEAGDGPHDIALAALMLSALDHPAKSREPYLTHLAEIAQTARETARLAIDVESAVHGLAQVLTGVFGYHGDRISYDDPRNADLIGVIDRRRGLPVALGVLYLHAARAAGYGACGLASPGHFLLRISHGDRSAAVDPFNGGVALTRGELGTPPRMSAAGPDEPAATEPVSDVDVLLRLENNLKLRALEAQNKPRALELARRMVLIAPRRADMWFELARLNESVGELGAARKAFDTCLSIARPGEALHNEAALALNSLKRRLN
jgi:regulator of sirC expression with transglutaminase-like and TPR domain